MTATTRRRANLDPPDRNELQRLYLAPIKISQEKYKDLVSLRRFCSQEGQAMIDSLEYEEKEDPIHEEFFDDV